MLFSRALEEEKCKKWVRSIQAKQYTYFDQLRFLETTLKKTSNSMLGDEGEAIYEEGSELIDSQLSDNTVSVKYTRPKNARNRGSRKDDDELIAALKKKAVQDVVGNKDNDDEDKLFLLSLLSEIKKVPPQNKLQLRANFISAIE